MRRLRQWLQPTGAYAWRWLSGMPPGGLPRADTERFTLRNKTLPRDSAPRQPSNLIAELRWDLRELRAEWHQLRVRRALGREFRDVERQVVAEHDRGHP
jgi:hypothetical protein